MINKIFIDVSDEQMRGPKTTSSFSFQANIGTLHDMLGWIRVHVQEGGYSEAEIKKIELALEEALVNIIEHAYSYETGMIEITYRFFPEDRIELVLKDYGEPFNPLENSKKVNPFAALEEREEGGLGIAFMHKLMDTIEYTREGESNVLTLKKKCGN